MSGWSNRIVGHGDEVPSQLLANPENWRTHPQAQQDALAGVLDSVGWVQTVVVNEVTNHIVDGHLRVLLAMQREEKSIPVVYVNLTPDEERLVLATLDPLSAMAGTDKEVLADLLASISSEDAAVTALLDDLAKNAGLDTSREGLTDPDDVPEPPKKPVTKPGDLWVLGDHRLLCGDATESQAHERVLAGEAADLVLTDPPYGVGLDYTTSTTDDRRMIERIAGDVVPLMRQWPVVLLTPGRSNPWAYPEPDWLLAWFEPAGVGSGPWGFTCWQPVLVYGKDPYLARGKGRHPDAWVGTGEGASSEEHPVAKPMGVWRWLLERGSATKGETILDPFLGSGTTIIAAQEMERRCYGIELDRAYCDVIVERWENFTGQKAKRSK